MLPPNISEAPPALSTINSLDNRTGGYKGWGPMANLATPAEISDTNPSNSPDYVNRKGCIAGIN